MNGTIRSWIAKQLKEGKDPNEIMSTFILALGSTAQDWVQWGDGRWRPNGQKKGALRD